MKLLFSHLHRIEFAETDMAGIVHFSHYFRWMASCEEAFFHSLKVPLVSKNLNLLQGWPRTEVSCKFNAPLRFEETVEVALSILELQEKWIYYQFHFFKKTEANEKILVAEGTMKTVFAQMDCLTGTIQACLMKKEIYETLKSVLEKARSAQSI